MTKVIDDNLNKIEVTLCAMSQGITQPWSESHILAHGLSGQRNKLGNALDHLLSHPNVTNANLIALMLAGELERNRVCKPRESVDVARDAIAYWWDHKCPYCAGRGVTDFEQTQCTACGGTGHREQHKSKQVMDAVGIINAAVQMMEGQLRARLAY